MYAVVTRQVEPRSSQHHFVESGRTSQADAARLESTERHGPQLAPAVRMERGNHAATIERVDKNAPSRSVRVPFGLHPRSRAQSRTGAPA
ncbi:hypothetical protein [Lysobacter sp. CA199]|uniref:hypothetical protein n=1 Tax=Lysobacter sp. CA199 TaxID=3455608 RepID=UPI003F8D85B5